MRKSKHANIWKEENISKEETAKAKFKLRGNIRCLERRSTWPKCNEKERLKNPGEDKSPAMARGAGVQGCQWLETEKACLRKEGATELQSHS